MLSLAQNLSSKRLDVEIQPSKKNYMSKLTQPTYFNSVPNTATQNLMSTLKT